MLVGRHRTKATAHARVRMRRRNQQTVDRNGSQRMEVARRHARGRAKRRTAAAAARHQGCRRGEAEAVGNQTKFHKGKLLLCSIRETKSIAEKVRCPS